MDHQIFFLFSDYNMKEKPSSVVNFWEIITNLLNMRLI